MSLVDKAKEFFYKMIDDFGADPYTLKPHLLEVEKWTKVCLQEMDADEEIVALGAWLHDIGHYPIPTDIDHAIRGEERATQFLNDNGYDPEKIKKVVHCVRAHRCKDVLPDTIEAKIIAFSDSASHMTQADLYLGMAKKFSVKEVLSKLERDYRDLSYFPEIKDRLSPLYVSWEMLIQSYGDVMGDFDK